MTRPIKDLSPEIINIILYGSNGEKFKMVRESENIKFSYNTAFEGVINNLERRYRESQSNFVKEEIESYMSAIPCDSCKGDRLNPESLAVKVGGINISELCNNSIVKILDLLIICFDGKEQFIAKEILKEIKERLGFLKKCWFRVFNLITRIRHSIWW